MPLFKYKAVTKQGQIIEHKVDALNQYMLIDKLKKNDLLPIEVTQVNSLVSNKTKKQKRNIESNNSVLKSIRSDEIKKSLKVKPSFFTKVKRALNKNSKITKRDIAIFTENFYLLKKANFNNIHALSTIINTTENENFKLILEDILLGVEAGDNMYVTMEYYEGVFPPIYINMIKVGEMSGSLTNALKQAREYLDESMALNKKLKEILVPNIVDNNLLSEFLNVNTLAPQKGIKIKLIEMANNNALVALNEKFELIKKDEERTIEANENLRKILKLEKLDRIEIFDNSNLFGSYNVSGMVVFVNGKPSKNDYRKFKISIDKNDDYGTMKEVIYRRYFRVLKDNLIRPDLIIVDGGIGQLNIAKYVLKNLNLDIPTIGLKKDDKHNTSAIIDGKSLQEIEIDKRSNLFLLLTKMQDEVHNYTINYHRQIRSKGSLESILDNIEGIGEVRKNKLLKKYKTISKMKNADIIELTEILPENVAINLQEILNDIEV